MAATIKETMLNYESERSSLLAIKEKLERLSSWDEVIRKWINVYNEFNINR